MTTILKTLPKQDGRVPQLNKTFFLEEGEICKTDYDLAYRFNMAPHDIESFDALESLIVGLQDEPRLCLVRGVPTGALGNVPRTLYPNERNEPASLRAASSGLSWVMLDFDKVPVASLGLKDMDERLAYLLGTLPEEFHEASFVYQWSASAGVYGWDYLSCHFWFMLSEPWFCRTHHDRALEGDWQGIIDPAPFTPNQVHYTAAPRFVGMPDPLGSDRVGVVRGRENDVEIKPWVRPVRPKPVMNDHEHYKVFGLSRFNDLLANIGPNFHLPILKAASHYAAVVSEQDFDEAFVTNAIYDAVFIAPEGKNPKRDYLSSSYLRRVIKSAHRKFNVRAA